MICPVTHLTSDRLSQVTRPSSAWLGDGPLVPSDATHQNDLTVLFRLRDTHEPSSSIASGDR